MFDAQPLRLVLLEVSKTKHQHSTVVDGLLRAHRQTAHVQAVGRPLLYAHTSLFDRLSSESRELVEYRGIPVMDPEKRRLVRKSLLEAAVVLWAMLRLKRTSELLLITTLLPSTGIVIEIMKWFFPKKHVVAMIHGEVEGALDPSKWGVGSFGFYVKIWMALRRFRSKLSLAVIDTFIAEGVCKEFADAISPRSLYVLPLLIERKQLQPQQFRDHATCCFIGYNTPNKGYDVFTALSERCKELSFKVIGGGIARDLKTGDQDIVFDNDDFIRQIAACDVAVFPYKGGYNLSLSAAATDAIAAGVHLIATPRPCFLALHKAFGSESVTICRDADEMASLLDDRHWLEKIRAGQGRRLSLLAQSPYDIKGVAKAVDDMLLLRPYAVVRSNEGTKN